MYTDGPRTPIRRKVSLALPISGIGMAVVVVVVAVAFDGKIYFLILT